MDICNYKINCTKSRKLIYAFKGENIYLFLFSKSCSNASNINFHEWVIVYKNNRIKEYYECNDDDYDDSNFVKFDDKKREKIFFNKKKFELSFPSNEEANDQSISLTDHRQEDPISIQLENIGEVFWILKSI